MVTCLSPSTRNGAESLLSCKYSSDMANMKNDPQLQPNVSFDKLVEITRRDMESSSKIVAKGVAGKYQAKRVAEVTGCETTLRILLEELGSGGGGGSGSGSGGGEQKTVSKLNPYFSVVEMSSVNSYKK